jgi:endoglucanase
MLAGHMDEIGFMVSSIDKDGFLRFQTLGGWWEQVMLAQRVQVITSRGPVPGIIGSKPPHILPPEDRKKMTEKKDMFIDIGAAGRDEAVAWGVRPGDPVVPDSPFQQMKNPDLLMAKAWDDRVGCALLVDVLRALSGMDHPNTVYGVGTVQEEVGLRGATTSANAIEPDVAFALEAGIAGDTPGVKEHEAQGRLGKGPVLLIYDASMIPNTRLRDLAVEVADAAGIPYQFDAIPGGGTDAGRIQVQGRGVPALVIGVTTRYVHSHTGIISLKDYALALDLLVKLVMALDEKRVASLVY